jgi:Flp pilus assembly protein TadG
LFLVRGHKDNMRRKKGQALVEIALALPILLLLLCGIIDFGRILYAGISINMAAQETARYASFSKTDAEIRQKAVNSCSLSDKDTKLSVSITPDKALRTTGGNVTVAIEYDVDYITPLMNKIIGEFFTVRTSSTIRVE